MFATRRLVVRNTSQRIQTQFRRRFATATQESTPKTEVPKVEPTTNEVPKVEPTKSQHPFDQEPKNIFDKNMKEITDVYTAEEEAMFKRWVDEMHGKHPTDMMDKSKFIPYSQEEIAALNSPPRYSMPYTDVWGRMRAPRIWWIFPVYLGVSLVIHANLQTQLGEFYYMAPINMVFPKKKEEITADI